jgi:hypothetical protein
MLSEIVKCSSVVNGITRKRGDVCDLYEMFLIIMVFIACVIIPL